MSRNVISWDEAALLIKKLMAESIPVIAFFVSADGSHTKLLGFVDSATFDDGLVICGTQGKPTKSSYIRVPLADGCECLFGDKREMAEEEGREELAAKYGEAVLMLRLPTDSTLSLFFNLNP